MLGWGITLFRIRMYILFSLVSHNVFGSSKRFAGSDSATAERMTSIRRRRSTMLAVIIAHSLDVIGIIVVMLSSSSQSRREIVGTTPYVGKKRRLSSAIAVIAAMVIGSMETARSGSIVETIA